MQYRDARPRALKTDRRSAWSRRSRTLRVAVVAAAAGLLAPAMALAAVPAPAQAAEVTIPIEGDVQARMVAHTGWNADAAAPSIGDCVRYGSAPDSAAGAIPNPGGSAGTEGSAWADGATGWVSFDDTAYTAHGTIVDGCLGADLDLEGQSALGFAPATIAAVQTGTSFNLGRMVHRNNPIYATNEWFRGVMDVRVLGLDLQYEWTLHETPNRVNPPSAPANNDVVEFVNTLGDQSFVGPDGNRYTLVVAGFTVPQADGSCPQTLVEPATAVNRFETVERTSTYGCLYAKIEQVRSLTLTKVVEAPFSAPAAIPAFGFTTTTDTPGSAWDADASLTPSELGTTGAASVTADFVVGETISIVEDPTSAPWSFTSLECVDGTGAVLPVTAGAQLTLSGDLSVTDPAAAPIECTYTNTFDPRAGIAILKTVTPGEGAEAAGYTGGDERVFAVSYRCEFDGRAVATGVADVSIASPAMIADLPAGAACRITGEDLATRPGDFADADHAWDGYEVGEPATVTADGTASLTIDNRFRYDEPIDPVDPVDPIDPVDPTDPSNPISPELPAGLPATGAGDILPFAALGIGLGVVGLTLLIIARHRRERG
jgi:hypothetical protein